jgi:hypothetical protein
MKTQFEDLMMQAFRPKGLMLLSKLDITGSGWVKYQKSQLVELGIWPNKIALHRAEKVVAGICVRSTTRGEHFSLNVETYTWLAKKAKEHSDFVAVCVAKDNGTVVGYEFATKVAERLKGIEPNPPTQEDFGEFHWVTSDFHPAGEIDF